MLLQHFKRNGPLTILLIVVIVMAVWVSVFVRLKGQLSLYFDINAMPLYSLLSSFIGTNPLPGIILSLLLVSLMAFLVVNLNTTLFFMNERTFLPALFYVLLGALFPQYQILNPAIFGAVFLMLAIKRVMESYRVKGTASNFFDAGMLISTGSLFYANLVWFGLILFVGIALLRPGNLKEIVLALLGLITPFILTVAFYYVSGMNVAEFFSVLTYNLFSKESQFVFNPLTIVAVIFSGVMTFLGISHVFMLFNSKKIQSRKTFSLFLWVFIISVAIYLFISAVSVEMIWITAIPASYYLSHYFVFNKRKVIPEVFFAIMLLLILANQLMYLK